MSENTSERFRGMLGFAMRAGKVIVGTEQVCAALAKKNRVKLVLIADGVSASTQKKITVKCEFYGVPVIEASMSCEDLGHFLGKTYAPACAAVTDVNFAKEIYAARTQKS